MTRASWMVAVLIPAAGAAAAERKEGTALTLYPRFGVVSETRKLEIPPDGEVTVTNVPALIDPTTVRFESLTDPAAKVLEQNFQYDLVSSWRLLEKYVGKHVVLRGEKESYSGTLLTFEDAGDIWERGGVFVGRCGPTPAAVILKDKSGSLLSVWQEEIRSIRFGEMPKGLRTRPTLLWKVATKKPGRHLANFTYQTDGLAWHAEYTLVVDQKDERADLSGWVSVENYSGKTYASARLKLIAGDVKRVKDYQRRRDAWYDDESVGAAEEEAVVEKTFFEYYMYTLGRPSTVADKEIKQLEMLAPVEGIRVSKRYLYNPLGNWRWRQDDYRRDSRSYGADKVSSKVGVLIEFANSKSNRLGIPLPGGKVGVYKRNPDDNALELVGEEKIDHTPTDENLSLQVGNAFDVVGERKQTDYQVEHGQYWAKESIEIIVRNHKEEGVAVRIKEPMYREQNWAITAKSRDYVKLDTRTVAWDVQVPKHGETKVTYTVVYTR